MGLDKWLQSEKGEKRKNKELAAVDSEKKDLKSKKRNIGESQKNLSKFILVCTNSKCKYQKVLMKKSLVTMDKTCPRCKSQMRVKG